MSKWINIAGTVSSVFVITVLAVGIVAIANLTSPALALTNAKGVVFGQTQDFIPNLTDVKL